MLVSAIFLKNTFDPSSFTTLPFPLMVSVWPDLNRKEHFAIGCSFGAEASPANHNTLSVVGLRTCKLDKLPQISSFLMNWLRQSNGVF